MAKTNTDPKNNMVHSDDAETLATNLYKQNIEISGKNKTLSLLSQLYEISILALAPKDLAVKISQTVQVNLSFELVGILLFDQQKNELSPLGFAYSERLEKVQKDFKASFDSLTVAAGGNHSVAKVVSNKAMWYTEKLEDVWGSLLPEEMYDHLNSEGHVRSTIVYPLIIQDKPIGILVLSLNRLMGDLVDYEKESIKNSINVIAVALDKALLYEQLKGLNEQLKALDKARAEFISIASHQLRTPPTTIKWYVDAVLSGDFGELLPEVKASLERVQSTNNSQISLIDDLLNASRIERGKMEFFFEMGDLAELARITYEQLIPQAQIKKLQLVYTPPAAALPEVMMDKEKVRQVINNFIDNAIKYTKQGEVAVSIEHTQSDLVLKVRDTGRGVAPDVIPILFAKYTRGKDAASAATGLGLGLYVAKVIIEQNHGKIWVESEGVGKGSTFAFSLPIESNLEPTSVVDLAEAAEDHK